MDEKETGNQAVVPQSHSRGPQSRGDNTQRPSNAVANRSGAGTRHVSDGGSVSAPATHPHPEGGSAPGISESTHTPTVAGPLQQMHRLIERAGEEGFPQDVVNALTAPIDDGLVSIKPNGLIFVSHPHYRDRLDRAFGVGAWCLVPLGVPRVEGDRVLYYGFLKARGQYIADAVGGCNKVSRNDAMTYDDAVEGAKSDCLVRCCKALPMFRECWDREYIDYWKATYAHEVAMPSTRAGRGWVKKGEYVRNFNTKPGIESESEFRKLPSVDKENQTHLAAIAGEQSLRTIASDDWPIDDPFVDDARDMERENDDYGYTLNKHQYQGKGRK